MNKLKERVVKILGFFLFMCILVGTFTKVLANENQSYNYTYLGVEKYGSKIGETETGIMNLKDDADNKYQVYCIDSSTTVKGDSKYSVANLEDVNYYSKENANKIRNIVMNAYPFITIEKVRTLSGIKHLTEEEAITGTQAAIWNYSNNKKDIKLEGKTLQLYNWYLTLPNRLYSKTDIANIDINKTVNIVNDKYEIQLYYKVNGKNADGSNISTTCKFDKNLQEKYNAKVQELGTDVNGYNVINISNISKDATFNFKVEANQSLSRNAYFYTPEGGKGASQSLVGVKDNKTKISNNINVDLNVSGHTLTLNKIDALSLKGIEGAEFQVSSNKEFTQNVITVTTKADGTATVQGLNTGKWFVKETKAPTGYIPNSEVLEIYINEKDIKLDIKNSKYGRTEVLKVDENQNIIKGAKFKLYKGNTITDENIIKNDLISDENGKITIENLLPGNYTLIETEAPEGYILNGEFINFEVKAYETTKITHINETIGYCTINLYKKDAVTKQQLAGTRIGIYSDKDFKNLVKEITTTTDGPVAINDLRPGTYYIKELEAPKGYLLDSAPKKITLAKNETAEIEFFNSKNYSTAGNYAGILIAGTALLIASGATLIIVNRKKLVHEKEN